MNFGPGHVSAFSMYQNIFAEDSVVVARCNSFGANAKPCTLEFHDVSQSSRSSDVQLTVPQKKSGNKKDKAAKTDKKKLQDKSKGKLRQKDGKSKSHEHTMISAMRIPTGVGNIETDSSVESYLPTSYFQIAFIGTVST